MLVVPWTEIESFNNIRKYTQTYFKVLNGQSVVRYRSKVKLHGNNAGVQVHGDGQVLAQSRTTILTPNNDLAGFARWTHAHEHEFVSCARNTIIFGEWCGPGIQSGVAINYLKNKIFAVFAARALDNQGGLYDTNELITDPDLLALLVQNIPGAYVLPWHSEVEIDWSLPDADLGTKVANINDQVLAVEKNDPWVKKVFDVDGTGEGLVFYPSSPEHLGYINYCNLVFKAKGEKHRVIATKASAQVNAQVAEGINGFVDLVLTEARFEQGAGAVGGFDKKKTGKFVAWIIGDVEKEAQDELIASGLEWKQVQKPVGDRARTWYLNKSSEK